MFAGAKGDLKRFGVMMNFCVRDAEIANVPFMASADGMQREAKDAKFSQPNEWIATTQCARQYR